MRSTAMLMVLLFGSVACDHTAPATKVPIGGGQAPAFTLQDIGGKQVSLSDFKGKVVILDFWATWCPPCRKEIPHFVELQDRYGAKGLVVIGVALDDERTAGEVRAFSRRMGINYPILYGNREVMEAYGPIEAIPTTFVIDRDGRIRARFVGYQPGKVFEDAVRPLLGS